MLKNSSLSLMSYSWTGQPGGEKGTDHSTSTSLQPTCILGSTGSGGSMDIHVIVN